MIPRGDCLGFCRAAMIGSGTNGGECASQVSQKCGLRDAPHRAMHYPVFCLWLMNLGIESQSRGHN